MAAAKGNQFAALAGDFDSDSESEVVVGKESRLKQQPTAPSTPAVIPDQAPKSPGFRTWSLVTNQASFSSFAEGKGSTKAIFNSSASPFMTKKKRGKTVHAEADHEGWVSIKKNQPMFVEDSVHSSDTEQEIKKEALLEALGDLSLLDQPSSQPQPPQTEGMRSLLTRGQNEMTALDWAERVRASLERAEQNRRPAGASQPTDAFVSALGRLSFFRRPMTETTSKE